MLPLLGNNRDPKKTATMILTAGGDKKTEAKDNVDQSNDPALEAAADDVLKAMELKSAKLLASALKDLVALCMETESYTEPAEEEVSL